MKILHFLSSFNNGGIETMLVNVANLQAKKHKVGILVLTDNILDSLVLRLDSSIKLIKINKPVGSKNIYYLLKMYWVYLTFKPDIFHFHDHNAPKLFPWKLKREKRFATIHNVVPTKWNKNVNQYIAISECVKAGFIDQTHKRNCTICYNGIDLSAFKCKKQYSPKPLRFLSIGRLYPSKGMDVVLKAFVWLKNNDMADNITLDIWGEGQERYMLEKLIKNGNLSQRVSLKGNVDSQYVEKHICDYDCVIQASRHEGFGLTAIEAMVAGVPTLLSNVDGYIEVSRKGKYSLLFEPENPEDLGRKIVELISHYEDAVNRALNAKGYVNNNYSVETLNNKLEVLYNS